MTIKPFSLSGTPPILSPEEVQQSTRLKEKIIARIDAVGGALSFAEYMQMALYEPGYGYYVAGQTKFGPNGDFITAPEVSYLFSYALAEQCADILFELGSGASILEFGGGSGRMAVSILSRLEQRNCLPFRYWILDLSPDLQERQRALIAGQIPHLLDRVCWLETLENFSMTGVVLANEVFDAMPVTRFLRSTKKNFYELSVTETAGEFSWKLTEPSRNLQEVLIEIERDRGAVLPEGYVSEINLNIVPWFAALTVCLLRGVVLCLDYGYPRCEYYLDERSQGTLMCHFRHHAHADPFLNPGMQDITAHVDFTAIASAAEHAGFKLAGFTTQSYFLLANGLDDLLESERHRLSSVAFLNLCQQAKTLLLPSEMGERFKVMGLSKMYDGILRGFDRFDFTYRL